MKTLGSLLSILALLAFSACQSVGPYRDGQVPTPPDTSVNYDPDAPEIHQIMDEASK